MIDRYQPDIIWFDSWLDQIPETYRQRFAAYYLNQAAQWEREVVIVRKQDDLPIEFTVLDHEKSRESKGSPRVWMTDDTISTGSWCYTRDLRIKPTAKVIHALIDTVAKNGVVLLNISPMADGTHPRRPTEGAARTRGLAGDQRRGDLCDASVEDRSARGPPSNRRAASTIARKFLRLEYSGKDIRYTRSKDGETVYAIALGWPGPATQFSALEVVSAAPDASVELLGYSDPLRHTITADRRLVVDLPDLSPAERPGQHAYSSQAAGVYAGGPVAGTGEDT